MFLSEQELLSKKVFGFLDLLVDSSISLSRISWLLSRMCSYSLNMENKVNYYPWLILWLTIGYHIKVW
jgi:hypothetical protein